MKRSTGATALTTAPALAATGCGSAGDGAEAPTGSACGSGAAAAHGRSRERLRPAADRHRGTGRTAGPTPPNDRVGAEFAHGADGDPSCTTGVVDDPGSGGSPWATRLGPRPRPGTVTGGRREGGGTAGTSSSSHFGGQVRTLHQQASGGP
ncbi:hypothetical protein Kpho02_46100 [Kitasatospora phosalacinea]|uniref:Uncharacterized protein n=1 Tax=Kitasatospora phosalacinea TaxID=2065 RepID=A0A9W6QBI5_9ACTN|nr:hypothetical protein [Kitasatospora phosalacinea]GLW72311.1 hypothetical protein Kpho02_46100 [Kitasatospora phosalacinea]